MKSLKNTTLGIATLLALPVLLAGCAANFNGTMTGTSAIAGPPINGVVMGGQQPILGAHIYLMSAGGTGYGSLSNTLLQAPGSIINGQTVTNTVQDSNGLYYVMSSPTSGSFDLTNDYTCPQQNSQVYLVSQGGDPGSGTNNPAAVLMVALGSCGTLSSNTHITMNELTTVAAISSLQQFMTDWSHIGASPVNQQGLQHAFITPQLLIDNNIGVPQGGVGGSVLPAAKIYTLGNAMAGCVNSSGPTSGACTFFFTGAVDESNPGTVPTDTFAAMLNIARYPAADPADIIRAIPIQSSYGNSLTSVHDFSLAIAYSGGGLHSSTSVAIDQDGNAWVANCGAGCDQTTQQTDDLVKITPYSSYQLGFIGSGSGIGIGSIQFAQGLALDESNYVWATNITPSVSIFQPNGQEVVSSPFGNFNPNFPKLMVPEAIAIDNTGLGWIANVGTGHNDSSVISINSNGTFGQKLTNANMQAATGLALDSNQPYGNIIVSDQSSGLFIFKTTGNTQTYDGGSPSTGGALHPTAIALDSIHNIWEVDPTVTMVYKVNSSGAAVYPASSGVAITGAQSIQGLAVDGLGNVLVPGCGATCGGSTPDSLYILDNNGNAVTGRSGLRHSSLLNPVAVAIDSSGNAWVANAGSGGSVGGVVEFIGVAAPVQTPLSGAVFSQTIGVRP